MTRQITRRQVLAAGAATVAAAAMGPFTSARAAGPIVLRVSSSAPPDKFGAHYLWYKPFEENLKKRARRQGQARVLSEQPARQGSGRRPAGQGRLGRHDDQRSVDLGHRRAGIRHARPGLRVRQLPARFKALDGGVGGLDKLCLTEPAARCSTGRRTSARAACTRRCRSSPRRTQGRQAARAAHGLHRDVQAHGRDPDADSDQRALHRAQTGVVDGFEHDQARVLQYKFAEVTSSAG